MSLLIPEFRENCLPEDAEGRNRFVEFENLVKGFESAIKTELRVCQRSPVGVPLDFGVLALRNSPEGARYLVGCNLVR